MVDAGLAVVLTGGVVPGGAGRPENGGDVQQLPGVEGAAHVRPLEGGRHRLHPRQGRAAPQGGHVHGGGGLGLEAADVVGVGEGPQSQAARLALLGHRLLSQLLQDPGQLQGVNGFFK